jgi:hypothetical protein
MKASLRLNESRLVDLNQISSAFDNPDATGFAQQVSDAAVTVVRRNGHVLPLPRSLQRPQNVGEGKGSDPKGGGLVVVIFADSRDSRLGPTFEKELKSRRPDAMVFHYYNDRVSSDATPSEVMPVVKSADQVVVAAFITHSPGRQIIARGTLVTPVGLSAEGGKLLGDVISAAPVKTAVIALGSPYLIESYPQTQNYICTYSLTPTAEVSAVKTLFGEIRNNSKLPVTLPGIVNISFPLGPGNRGW